MALQALLRDRPVFGQGTVLPECCPPPARDLSPLVLGATRPAGAPAFPTAGWRSTRAWAHCVVCSVSCGRTTGWGSHSPSLISAGPKTVISKPEVRGSG